MKVPPRSWGFSTQKFRLWGFEASHPKSCGAGYQETLRHLQAVMKTLGSHIHRCVTVESKKWFRSCRKEAALEPDGTLLI